jgi:RNA polymerase sigma-70 factor (ECF subfamily)
VRRALDRLPEREQRLLLLQAEGYSYREIAEALELNEASVGVLLARARRAFRKTYEEPSDAP